MSISVIEATNVELPLQLVLLGGLSASDKLVIAISLEENSCLAISLKNIDDDLNNSRVFLSLSLFLDRAICKSGKNEQWDHVELVKHTISNSFRLGIVTGYAGYRLEVNGNLFCSFPHQYPSSEANLLEISIERGAGNVSFFTLLKEIRWIPVKDSLQIAEIALQAGFDNENNEIFLGRGLKNNNLLVVSVNYAKNKATVALDGKEWSIEEFKVLEKHEFFCWRKILEDKRLPARSVEAGFDENGNILYVGRIMYEGNLLPGSVNSRNCVLSVPFKGKELKFSSSYEVLMIVKIDDEQTSEDDVLMCVCL